MKSDVNSKELRSGSCNISSAKCSYDGHFGWQEQQTTSGHSPTRISNTCDM